MLKETFWIACYNDGTRLIQYEPNGSENKYSDIDRSNLIQFILFRNGKPLIVIHLDNNKKLIYRMRRAMNNKGYEEVVFLAGWQERTNGKNIQMIMFLFEDNHIEIVDRFYENHLWFYSINFLKEEEI
jgi:hypothetical protein